MKKTLLLACGLVAVTVVSPVSAQSYKWKDSKGQTIISDTPPPRSAKAQKSGGIEKAAGQSSPATGKPVTAADGKAPGGPKTTAEKDMEFRKRQQEAKEKAEKAAKEQEVAAERRKSCESARQAISNLQASTPIVSVNEKGERVTMNDRTRQEELARANRIAQETCR